MSLTFRLLTALLGKRIAGETKRHLRTIARDHDQAGRSRASALLRQLAGEPGPHAVIGATPQGETVSIPIALLANAWGIVSGGTGSGKSMVAAIMIEALLEAIDTDLSFGVLDAKGEIFERAIFLIARLLRKLPPAAAERLRQRLVIIDFSSIDPITSFNLASAWSGADLDFFSTSRMETLEELFPGDGISLRGGSILKHGIKLLAEQHVPFRYIDLLLSSESFRSRLLAASKDQDLHQYFRVQLPSESRATVAALRARLTATLFNSASLKLALSGATAPNFRALMDSQAIILVNCSGATIPRTTARLLQTIVMADISRGIFNRDARSSHLWICDESQHFFKTKFLRDQVTDCVTMSRSKGVCGTLITQNLANAVQDAQILETIHTNAKWALVLRGSSKDAAFLQSAFPVSGRREKPRPNPYAPAEFYSVSEERTLMLHDIAHLPDRDAWLWMKSLTGEAIRIQTRTIDIPVGKEFHDTVERVRSDPSLGQRQSRTAYLEEMSRRDATLRTTVVKPAGRDLIADLTNLYRADEEMES